MSQRNERLIVAAAAGIFFGASWFDVLPFAERDLGLWFALGWMAIGLFAWWLQKRALSFVHRPEMPPLVTTALWLHSVLEGVVTGLSFGVSRAFGVLVLVGMVLHLLPEFFGATALLRNAGTKTKTSIWITLAGFIILFASFALTYRFLPEFGLALPIAVAISGGAFIYIGAKSFWNVLKPVDYRGMIWSAFILGVMVSAFVS